MQYILTEDELRALKAQNDVKIQAKILAEDYRDRLCKAILDGLTPFLRSSAIHGYPDPDSRKVLERLKAVFSSVPVIPPENKV